MSFYQVVGSGLWMIDYPHGDAKAHRTGDVFEATPDNQSVTRGLQMGRLREMSDRESTALRAAKVATAVSPTSGPPVKLAAPAVLAAPTPITPTPKPGK